MYKSSYKHAFSLSFGEYIGLGCPCWTKRSSRQTETTLGHGLTRSALVLGLEGEPWGTPSLSLQGRPGAGGSRGSGENLGESLRKTD